MEIFHLEIQGLLPSMNSTGTNVTEGQYFVGTSPPAWNGTLNICGDHTYRQRQYDDGKRCTNS